jgi:hypothetical protein
MNRRDALKSLFGLPLLAVPVMAKTKEEGVVEAFQRHTQTTKEAIAELQKMKPKGREVVEDDGWATRTSVVDKDGKMLSLKYDFKKPENLYLGEPVKSAYQSFSKRR